MPRNPRKSKTLRDPGSPMLARNLKRPNPCVPADLGAPGTLRNPRMFRNPENPRNPRTLGNRRNSWTLRIRVILRNLEIPRILWFSGTFGFLGTLDSEEP